MTTYVGDDHDNYPYSAVTYIEVEYPDGARSSGSGVVVGKNDVLTASHVIYSDANGGLAEEITVYPGKDGSENPYGSYEGGYANYFEVDQDNDGMSTRRESENDIALLGFEEEIGDITGWFGIDFLAGDGNFNLTGYPGAYSDFSGPRMTNDFGSAFVGLSDVWNHGTIEAYPGHSGGPLWYSSNDGQYVAGIASTGSWAADVFAQRDNIPEWIRGNNFLLDENQPPVASDDQVTMAAGTTVTFDVLSNDSDPDGDSLSLTNLANSANGQALITNDDSISYTPDSGFTGTDLFTYTVADDNGGTDTATVEVTVETPNRAPSLEAMPSQTVEENSPVGMTVVQASATDPDGDTFSYGLDGADAAAFAIDSVSGEITLAASPDFEAPADADGDNTYELTVRATDADGEASDESFTVDVVDVNDTDDTTEPDNPTDDPQARVFLAADGDFTIADAAVVFGRSGGDEAVELTPGALGVRLDGNVETVTLPQPLSSTTFQVRDGRLEVRDDSEPLITFTSGLNEAVTLQFNDGEGTLTQTGAERFSLAGPGGEASIGDSPVTPEIGLGGAVKVDGSDDGRTFDAASGDTTLEFADGDYDVTVDSFAEGDELDFADVAGSNEAILNILADSDLSDGQKTLSATDPADGQAVTVTLTGLTTGQDVAVFNAGSFANAFGSDALVV